MKHILTGRTTSDTLDKLDELDLRLNCVNECVHQLQHILDTNSHGFSSALMCEDRNTPSIPLESKDYQLFTTESSFGDLRLGYGTTGKTLYHLYTDKDIVTCETKVSPQMNVTSNFYAYFGIESSHEINMQKYKQWCQDNKIAEILNLDPLSNTCSLGYIVLGQLDRSTPETKDKTNLQILEYYKDFNVFVNIEFKDQNISSGNV